MTVAVFSFLAAGADASLGIFTNAGVSPACSMAGVNIELQAYNVALTAGFAFPFTGLRDGMSYGVRFYREPDATTVFVEFVYTGSYHIDKDDYGYEVDMDLRSKAFMMGYRWLGNARFLEDHGAKNSFCLGFGVIFVDEYSFVNKLGVMMDRPGTKLYPYVEITFGGGFQFLRDENGADRVK